MAVNVCEPDSPVPDTFIVSVPLLTVGRSEVSAIVPVVAGIVIVVAPAAAAALKLVVPDVEPLKLAPPPPIVGVVNDGEVAKTAAPVPVSSVNAPRSCDDVKEPRDVALPTEVTAPVKLAFVVTLPAVNPEAVPVMFVPTNAEGVPSAGVTNVGLVANTAEPVPVSSVKAPAKLAELNEPSTVALPVDVTAPVKFAFVVTLPAVRPEAVPVMFVPTKAEGVPNAGVTRVGEVANTKAPVPVSSVTAAARLAELGVARKVATFEPKPLTPEEIGKPVAFVKVADTGVPRAVTFPEASRLTDLPEG